MSPKGTACLIGDTLTIRANTETRGMVESMYRVTRIPAEVPAYRLRKIGGESFEVYDVAAWPEGETCECKTFLDSRRTGTCKHLDAARAVGLFTRQLEAGNGITQSDGD